MQPAIFKEVQALFRQGIFNEQIIQNVFIENGFENLYKGFVDEFGQMIKFGKRVSDELGIGYALTEKNFQFLEIASSQIERNIEFGMHKFANDLANSGLQSEMGGRGFKQIVEELRTQFAGSGRRFETEAYTGITQFDSAQNFQLFQEAEIDKFVYVGPADGRTRDACLNTLGSSQQETGWTMDDINSSETPFMTRGGYNCRHEWLPKVKAIEDVALTPEQIVELKQQRK